MEELKVQIYSLHQTLNILYLLLGVIIKSAKIFLLDFLNSMSVNNVYVKCIYIYWSMQSMSISEYKDFSMTDWYKSNDFSISFPNFKNFQWFFHDLETHLNFNDFSRAVGTLFINGIYILLSAFFFALCCATRLLFTSRIFFCSLLDLCATGV